METKKNVTRNGCTYLKLTSNIKQATAQQCNWLELHGKLHWSGSCQLWRGDHAFKWNKQLWSIPTKALWHENICLDIAPTGTWCGGCHQETLHASQRHYNFGSIEFYKQKPIFEMTIYKTAKAINACSILKMNNLSNIKEIGHRDSKDFSDRHCVWFVHSETNDEIEVAQTGLQHLALWTKLNRKTPWTLPHQIETIWMRARVGNVFLKSQRALPQIWNNQQNKLHIKQSWNRGT